MMWQCLINGVATFILRCKVHCMAAVSSAADGRHTRCLTIVVRAADGRRTMTNTL